MKITFNSLLRMIGTGAWLGAAALGYSETVNHTVYGNMEEWNIDSPIVTSNAWHNYAGEITFRPGDTVLLSAGGCVQTGGHGLTWKRYVDPEGPNSTNLYHGWVSLPGLPAAPLSTWLHLLTPGSQIYEGRFTINDTSQDLNTLWLAYSDDDYSDNGYYSPDNGTGDQCKNVGNAWVHLTITHQ